MKKSISVKLKKGPGRPLGREYPVAIQLKLTEAQAAELDMWRKRQEGELSRSEAIRRLVELGLKAKRK